MILIGGVITCAQMGRSKCINTCPQPVYSRPMFGAFGTSMEKFSNLCSRPSIENTSLDKLGLKDSGTGFRHKINKQEKYETK